MDPYTRTATICSAIFACTLFVICHGCRDEEYEGLKVKVKELKQEFEAFKRENMEYVPRKKRE